MPHLDRRQMLAAGAAALTTAGLSSSASSADKAVRNGRLKQSVCAWCFTSRGDKWSLDKTCQVAAALGCPSVELVMPRDFPTLAKHGLVCGIASNGLGFQRGFNNPRHRDELIAKTKDVIDACADAKFPSVIGFVGMKWRNPTDPTSGEIPRDEAFKNCVAGIKLVAAHAEKRGVTLCIEHLNSRDGSDPMTGHPGYQGDDLDWVVSILTTVGSPRVKLLFDIYHVQIMHGDLIRRIDQTKELIGHIHTAGVPGRGELDDNQEINYPPVMRKLRDIGYTGYVGHEFIPTRDPLAGLRHAVTICDV
jgi:hydroxypyruvate isomerase